MKIFKQYSIAFLSIITGALFFNACENSTGSEEHIEHSDPFGVAMILNEVEIALQENGEISYNEGNHLELEVGEETDLITIRWIAEDGDRFVPDTEDGYGLNWVVENEDVLEIEQHDEDGAWSFHLIAKSAGDSHLQFQLWHNDHADFTSLEFEVHVESTISSSQVTNESGTVLVEMNEDGSSTSSYNDSIDEIAVTVN